MKKVLALVSLLCATLLSTSVTPQNLSPAQRIGARAMLSAVQGGSDVAYNPDLQNSVFFREIANQYLVAAKRGDTSAQYNFGVMREHGFGVRRDFGKAAKWYQLAADKDDARALFRLGRMSQDGRGVPQDFAKAMKWYQLAAAQELEDAQIQIGIMFAEGYGVPQDHTEAMKWYRLAAEQGNAEAQYELGLMYEQGQGVPPDFFQGHFWYDLASFDVYPNAAASRDRVALNLSPAQIVESELLVRDWRAKHQ